MKTYVQEQLKKMYNHFGGHAGLSGIGAEQSPLLSRIFDPSNTDLATFFNVLFKGALVIGAMLAVLRLGYAGFVYMTTDVWSSKQSATTIIQETVLGLLLLLGVWIILNQINPNLLNLNILRNVQPAPTVAAPPSSGTGVSGAYDQNTCTSFGGTTNPSTGACVFPNGSSGSPPAESWCSGNNCYGSQSACNANRRFFENECVRGN